MTADTLYAKLKNVNLAGHNCRFSFQDCEELIPMINEINRLKKEQNAVILVHSYVSPEIIYSVADYVGDSYALSKNAMHTDAKKIIFVAVRFMGETAKLLNPNKEVLIPSTPNGCSLADSIDGEDIRKLKEQFSDYSFICYINTTAEVKAQCDVCVTSSNVYDIVENIDNDKIFFLPDKLMGENIIKEMQKRRVKKDIKLWDGTCYVHEEYEAETIDFLRAQYEDLKVLSHPECSPAVINQSDFIGSTSQLLNYIKEQKAENFLMLTECGLSSRIQVEMPEKRFVGTCSMCRYMKANNLKDILRVLKSPNKEDKVNIEQTIIQKANKCLEEMFRLTK